jgi:hypothetical protein
MHTKVFELLSRLYLSFTVWYNVYGITIQYLNFEMVILKFIYINMPIKNYFFSGTSRDVRIIRETIYGTFLFTSIYKFLLRGDGKVSPISTVLICHVKVCFF